MLAMSRLFPIVFLLLLMQLAIPTCSLSSASSTKTHTTTAPYLHATFDYSAANGYIEAHYGQKNYFTSSKHANEAVYNARNLDDFSRDTNLPILERYGFDLYQLPLRTNWNDLKSIQRDYLPKLELLLQQAFGEEEQALEDVVFWHPMWRNNNNAGDRVSPSSRTSPPAPLVHIDNDVGAYEFEDFLSLLQNNCVNDVNWEKIRQALLENKRFVIVNAWRNIHPTESVQQTPLAIYCPRYNSKNDCFPNAKPQQNSSLWYVFPHMTPDEVLLFKQYDRRIDRTSDLWHCALTQQYSLTASSERQSLDIRALCIFNNTIPDELNRYDETRPRATLSLQESGCFCDEQATKYR